MRTIADIAEKVIRYTLFATAFLPLVVVDSFVFPFVSGKIFFFHAVIELTVIVLGIHIFASVIGKKDMSALVIRARELIRQPLTIALFAFFVSALVSTFFAISPYNSWWGGIERGGGVFDLLHFFVFFALVGIFFRQKDWETYFKLTLGVGAIVMVYAWAEYSGIEHMPFMPVSSGRPDSFLGNAALLGAYLLLFASACGVLYATTKSRAWKIFSLALGFSAVLTMFITDTRGTLVGLAAAALFLGVIFFRRFPAHRKRIIACALAFLVLVMGAYAFRNSSFIASIPGAGRLLATHAVDATLQSRIFAIKSGFAAFQEYSLFGWGVDHYNVAYNAHYDPRVAVHEEAWFDRAHNKIVEIGVEQGMVGLIAYLALFGVFFVGLFRVSRAGADKTVFGARIMLGAGVCAYFVQNLFLFDSPAALMLLFLFFACAGSRTLSAHDEESRVVTKGRTRQLAIALSSVFLVVGVACAMYLATIQPMLQLRALSQALHEREEVTILGFMKKFIEPYTFVAPDARYHFLDVITNNGLARTLPGSLAVNVAAKAMDEAASKEANYEPRNFLLLAEFNNERGKTDSRFFEDAEIYAQRAIALSPRRQSLYYPLSLALAGQNKFDDAIEVARGAVALNERVAKARFNLGLQLAFSGRAFWDEARDEFDAALTLHEQHISSLSALDEANLGTLLTEMLAAYIPVRDQKRVMATAELYLRLPEAPIDDLALVMDLAEQGDWEALVRMVKSENR